MESLVLVTLTYNNVEEARKTMASVALQDLSASRYLVIDSSDGAEAREIKRFATAAKAEYHWVEPQGVYPAMNCGVDLLVDDDFVWFINSSDWLAGPESISALQKSLSSDADWVIGGLARLGDKRNPFHPIPTNGIEFVDLLRGGEIGFPHPAAMMKVRTVRQLGGFDTTLRIAADYKLALGFATLAGPPAIAQVTVAVHVPTGLTSRNRFRHAWEKSVARRRVESRNSLLQEARGHLLSILSYVGFSSSWKRRLLAFPAPQGFSEEIDSWPVARAVNPS